MGWKSPLCKHRCQVPHNGEQDDANIRPKQLRNREVSWEGSHRSKLMSRRTERSYKADGTDQLAPLSEVRCLVPEVNDPVAQQLPCLRGSAPALCASLLQLPAARVCNGPWTTRGLRARECRTCGNNGLNCITEGHTLPPWTSPPLI